MRLVNLCGYIAIPFAFLAHWLGKGASWEPAVTFTLAAVGVIPLAALMGEATEHLAHRSGPTWGGLLNATFGNAAELIIGVIALSKGLNEIVKASLTGSILGNSLLVAGGAMVFGGIGREKQTFNRNSAEANAGLLTLAVAAMLFPAIFHHTALNLHDPEIVQHEHAVSYGTSAILIIVYVLGLLFTLKTHKRLFSRAPQAAPADHQPSNQMWSTRRSLAMLLLASAGVAIVAELLVGSAENMAHRLGWSPVFVGVVLLAIIGNAAEHSTALLLARRDDMDTAMTITYQSSIQIALFVTPLLIFISAILVACGIQQGSSMNLVFTPMEIVAVLVTVGVVVVYGLNGETNWFEGAVLLALYAILAIAFFYIPVGHTAR